METSLEWYDAREVLPNKDDVVIVSGLPFRAFSCWDSKIGYVWLDEESAAWYPVLEFQLWCHWPTVNDEGCVG